MISKIANYIGLGTLVNAVLLKIVYAQSKYGLNEAASKANYETDGRDVYGMINIVVSAVLAILAIVFFILIVYSGMQWMTSRGNDEKVAAAKSTIEAAVIGLVIVLVSYGITTFLFELLGKA